jgi:hypothetical protein
VERGRRVGWGVKRCDRGRETGWGGGGGGSVSAETV